MAKPGEAGPVTGLRDGGRPARGGPGGGPGPSRPAGETGAERGEAGRGEAGLVTGWRTGVRPAGWRDGGGPGRGGPGRGRTGDRMADRSEAGTDDETVADLDEAGRGEAC